MDGTELRKAIKDLLASQQLAVLATQGGGQPYASLVAVAATDDLKHLLFATTRTTRKFANISKESRVALLVDNRANQDSDFHNAISVTAMGIAREVNDREREHFLKLYLKKHPHLQEFVTSPTCALLNVKVERYYMVSRFQNVMELHVDE
ncbi:MAG: pyridoxamine 5'-phosphate oxidase family protein [Deltaproteobacteria bacterium]|nr:MAG: pyridoxamine 5'-phosphate oxidase family protein [Deltaproteobacteria bacterium]